MTMDMKVGTRRDFFSKRPWFHGDGRLSLISDFEYEELMERNRLDIPEKRIDYLLAFIDGWKAAKK